MALGGGFFRSGFEPVASEDYKENGGEMVISGKPARPWRGDRMPGEELLVNKEWLG